MGQVAFNTVQAGGSWRDRARSPQWWAFAVSAAVLGAVVLFWTPNYPIGVAAAVALPVLFRRHPVALVAFMLSFAEEVVPGPEVGAVTTLGNQAFYAGKVPLILILALTAAVVSTLRIWPLSGRAVSLSAKVIVVVLAGLTLLSIIQGFIAGQSPLSAVNQNARPFIACAVGVAIGLGLRLLPKEERLAGYAVVTSLAVLTVAAVYAVAMNMPADSRVSRYYIFYDSALPALAAAVFLALVAGQWRRDWRRMLIMAACLVIVVVGFRRGVWIAAAFAVVAALVLVPRRIRSLGRLAAAAAGLTLLLVAAPGLATDVHARLVGTPTAAQAAPASTTDATGPSDQGTGGGSGGDGSNGDGSNGDSSGGDSSNGDGSDAGSIKAAAPTSDESGTVSGDVAADSSEGHTSDLRVGWRYVEQHFWSGAGPLARQLPGLVADKSLLVYVHNEWLQDWLKYGPLAPLLVTVFLGLLAIMGIRVLRRPDAGPVQLSAAMLAVITPVVLMLFPYVTTTTRWPLLLGVAAGILGLRDTVAQPKVVGPHPPDGPSAG